MGIGARHQGQGYRACPTFPNRLTVRPASRLGDPANSLTPDAVRGTAPRRRRGTLARRSHRNRSHPRPWSATWTSPGCRARRHLGRAAWRSRACRPSRGPGGRCGDAVGCAGGALLRRDAGGERVEGQVGVEGDEHIGGRAAAGFARAVARSRHHIVDSSPQALSQYVHRVGAVAITRMRCPENAVASGHALRTIGSASPGPQRAQSLSEPGWGR